MAKLQEGEAKTTRVQLFNRECQNGPQQQHVWSNVEKTFAVTGTEGPILQGGTRVVGWLVEAGAVGELDDAQPQATRSE